MLFNENVLCIKRNILKPLIIAGHILLFFLSGGGLSDVNAQTTAYQESEVKAAFLFNFGKYVEWPQGAFVNMTSPFGICVLGQNPFGEALGPLDGKTIQGRETRVHRMQNLDSAEKCQILFISRSEKERLPQIFKTVNNLSILTVAEMKGFTESGGMINFIRKEDRVHFEINIKAAARAKLKISSQLLKLAKIAGD